MSENEDFSSNESASDVDDLDLTLSRPQEVKKKWSNRERVLVLCSRGVSFRDRHLMNDLKNLMPHAKGESKMNKKEKLTYLNEISEMKNCTKCVYFEARKKKDLYVWFSNIEKGPSAKFLLQNVHTSGELKLSGNCLKSSRPILSFDKTFDENPQNQLLKELFTQIFSTPNYHPKSQPFIDHVLNFSIEDKRIWFRNYQIVDESSAKLEEIGPRMVFQLIKIFEGSFGGSVLYENPDYICPNTIRRQKKMATANKYIDKVHAKTSLKERRAKEPESFATDPIFEAVYDPENAKKVDSSTRTNPELRKLKRKLDSKHKSRKKKQKLAGKE